MNSLNINTLPFRANFYTRMPNEKELVTPFELETKDDNYYSLNHSFISRSRITNDVFQLLDPKLDIVDKLEVNYTVDSFSRTNEENVNKLVNIYEVLLEKVKLNETVTNLKQRAFEYEILAKELRKEAKEVEEFIPTKISDLMVEKGLTTTQTKTYKYI